MNEPMNELVNDHWFIQRPGPWIHLLNVFEEVLLQVPGGGLDHRLHLRPDGVDQLLFGVHVEGQLSRTVQQPLVWTGRSEHDVHTHRKGSHWKLVSTERRSKRPAL